MRISLCGLLLAIAVVAFATEPSHAQEQTLRQKVQGEWSRSNGNSRFLIKGDKCTEFKANAPQKVHATAKIEYPPGKDYAVAKFDNDWTIWIYSAGKDVLAIEAFRPSGELGGIGQIVYRHGDKTGAE